MVTTLLRHKADNLLVQPFGLFTISRKVEKTDILFPRLPITKPHNAPLLALYEQGKADALKNSVATSKNISMDPRQSFSNDNTSGPKVRVLGDDSPNFKFKIKNK